MKHKISYYGKINFIFRAYIYLIWSNDNFRMKLGLLFWKILKQKYIRDFQHDEYSIFSIYDTIIDFKNKEKVENHHEIYMVTGEMRRTKEYRNQNGFRLWIFFCSTPTTNFPRSTAHHLLLLNWPQILWKYFQTRGSACSIYCLVQRSGETVAGQCSHSSFQLGTSQVLRHYLENEATDNFTITHHRIYLLPTQKPNHQGYCLIIHGIFFYIIFFSH